MIRFEDPQYLLVLLLIPLWLMTRKPNALGFSSSELLIPIQGKGLAGMAWFPALLKTLGLVFLILALADPQFEDTKKVQESKGINIFLCLDLSSSMSENPMSQDQSTLDILKEVMEAFIKKRTQDRIGLISFATYPQLVCPLTHDQAALIEHLRSLDSFPEDSPFNGTAIGAGLAEAARRMGSKKGVVVLITDGEENRYFVDPLDGARLCKSMGIRVYPIAAGQAPRKGAHEMIARITGGEAAWVKTEAELKGVCRRIDRMEKTPVKLTSHTLRKDGYDWALLPAMFLLLMAFVLDRVLFLRLP